MPWCDTCDKQIETAEKECNDCGAELDTSDQVAVDGPPWHFWVLIAALVAYLVWRAVVFIASIV